VIQVGISAARQSGNTRSLQLDNYVAAARLEVIKYSQKYPE